MSDFDLDELRCRHEETRDAALALAARVAERTVHGPFDTGELALTHALAATLSDLLRREKQLRSAIRAVVAG